MENNAELHALYSSPDIIRNIKSRRLRWAGHVARMGETRNAYRVLVERSAGKRPLGRPRRRWEDNIKMDLMEVGYDDRDWINFAQDRGRAMAGLCEGGNEPPGFLKASEKELRQPSFYRGASRSRWGKSGCDVGKRTVPVRKYDSILKALSSLENANIFLERTILSDSVLLAICGLGFVWSWNFISRRGGSEVHSKTQTYIYPCIVDPYHHGMARPQVADRGDCLQIWRIVVNILNKQSLTADEGWSSSLGVGRRANNPSPCETWTLTLREEHRLRVFENKVLRKIFGAKRDEVTGEWRKLHNTELHALYSSPDIISNIKSRRLRWAGHIARMGESRNACRVLVGKPEGKRPLGRPRHRWEDNIKMDLREVGYDGKDCINLAQDGDQWTAYVRAAMNLRVP
ncbi:hypothetical protein ANN_03757 [Periplaneta americana]|uniref:Uncharacterized protein n=1 Tax=Periplaneta americana TaxID=6978 RepID=A0ABQ8U4C9_PERAM|nr:hypothetical protein ANN_03757 [Periplaneta americana]